MKTVIKRDGRKVPFDSHLITQAVLAAMTEVGDVALPLAERISNEIESQCGECTSVEEIQDMVEKALMDSPHKAVAKAYILYRDKRNKARNWQNDEVLHSIINAEKNDITRENANSNSDTPAGMMMKIASESSKRYAMDYLISERAKELINNNILHIHDQDLLPSKSLTCLQSPIDKILDGGLVSGHGEARPAKRIETASALSCISLESTQNEMHGGQAIPAFDFYLAPYVRKTFIEELKKLERVNGVDLSDYYNKEFNDYVAARLDTLSGRERYFQHAMNETVARVHQAMEAFIHNMNMIHSRGGNQVVFSSINYGTDTSAEGRCVMRELLLSTEQGVGNGSTAIFPIQIWKKKRGVSYLPEDPNYDLYQLACRVTARRFFPNFLNLDATFNQSPEWRADDPKRYLHEVATMGCVDGDEQIVYMENGGCVACSFEVFWNTMAKKFTVHNASEEGYDLGEYMDLSGIRIADKDGYVDCSRIIRNPDKRDWMRVVINGGTHTLLATADHIWEVVGRGTVPTRHLCVGDKVTLFNTGNNYYSYEGKIEEINFIGFRNRHSYDVTTASEHFIVSNIYSHNCRTRVFENRFGNSTSVGRGNLSFSTINLPGLALSVMDIKDENERIDAFFNKLSEAMNVMGEQLYERYQYQCTALAKQFPLLMSGMWVGSEVLKPTDKVEPVLKHGTLGMGFIGLAECLIALVGKHHGESEEAQKLGLRIVQTMFDRARFFSISKNMNYSVLATPAEGLSGKFTKKDRKKYGIIPGVTDKDYYTNSNHVPVYYHCSAEHKAAVEGPYHEKTRGGHIFYVELDGDATHNLQAVSQIVDLMDKYNIGYCSVNHNRNRCMDCGYESAEKDLKACPQCGGTDIDRLQRITGYLVGTTDRWNSGKLAELNDRVTHG